jgi:hypothetical protein
MPDEKYLGYIYSSPSIGRVIKQRMMQDRMRNAYKI